MELIRTHLLIEMQKCYGVTAADTTADNNNSSLKINNLTNYNNNINKTSATTTRSPAPPLPQLLEFKAIKKRSPATSLQQRAARAEKEGLSSSLLLFFYLSLYRSIIPIYLLSIHLSSSRISWSLSRRQAQAGA